MGKLKANPSLVGTARTMPPDSFPLRFFQESIDMALKPDEKFVSESLIRHFGSDKCAYREGEDPPDIYLSINEETIAVEITRLSPVSFDENGFMQNRKTQDSFGANICDELNSKLKNIVPTEVHLLLEIHVPVANPRKYKKEIKRQIESLLQKEIKVGDRQLLAISGHKVVVNFLPDHPRYVKKIGGIIANDNSISHILSNAEAILTERIIDKVEKCKNLLHTGKRWLALYNDYFLADTDIYSQAINNISIIHDFDKIFLVSDKGVVKELLET
jgi:hypothetical protein